MFIPTFGPKTARIMLVGEAPGAEEERMLQPFVGASGQLLNQILKQVGLNRYDCLITNVARERPPGNDISYFFHDSKRTKPKDFMQEWISILKKEILEYKPNIIITLGDIAYWALCGEHGVTTARGYITESTLVPGVKVLPTFHPAHVLRNWPLRFHLLHDFAKAVKNSKTPELVKDTRTFITTLPLKEVIQYYEDLAEMPQKPIAFDIETSRRTQTPGIIGIATDAYNAVSFSLTTGEDSRFQPESELKYWLALQKVLDKHLVVMQNGKFDLASLWHYCHIYTPNFYFDVMVACHILWPEVPRNLGFLTSICTNFPRWKHTSAVNPGLYNAMDCSNTYAVFEELLPRIENDPEHKATFAFEMAQNEIAALLELQGIYVDKTVQQSLIQEVNVKIAQLETSLKAALGKDVNVKSPKQLSQLLYVDLSLPVQYKRRTSITESRKVTTDSNALKRLLSKTKNVVLQEILELKKLYKLLTFLDVPTSEESRVHTSYNITGANPTVTKTSDRFIEDAEGMYKSFGRWSSSASIILPYGSGNLQNIPKAARKMYTVPDGYTLLQADYMQAEAVVVAYVINDQRLIKLFKESFGSTRKQREENGWDIHKLTAALMFSKELHEVTKELRDIGKRLRHATNYSAGPGVLANSLEIPVTEAKKLLELYHNSCPQLRITHKEIQQVLKDTHSLTNLLGRKHMFLERYGDDLFRSAYSFIPQSTVGDLLNTALIRLYHEHGDWLTIYLQLHDAVYVVVKDADLSRAITAMRQCMLIPLSYREHTFTIDVDFSIGKSWGSMKEIDWQDYVRS